MLTIRSLEFFLCLGFFVTVVSASEKLETIYEFNWIDYVWNTPADKIAAEKSGDYNYTSPVIIDVDTWKDGRVFVTVIRSAGVPASLATVSTKKGKGGPLLKPYPDWSWFKKGDCNGITNVYRIYIDECDRLWVLDNGKIDDKQICKAQLLVFDLNTDKLIDRIKIDNRVTLNSKTGLGLLVTPIVETEGSHCEKTYVYMADVEGHGLIVYNGTGSPWRLESPVYVPQATANDVEIVGETFHLNDGVIGMALSPKTKSTDSRKLFFRPFACYDMVSVETSDLHKSYYKPVNYAVTSNILSNPAVAMAFSSEGVLFFGLTTETSLACWDMDKPMTAENIEIVDKDTKRYQFVSGLKIIPKERTKKSEEIWMVTNRFQKIMSGTQNFKEINFRIMRGRIDDFAACAKHDTRSVFKKMCDWFC